MTLLDKFASRTATIGIVGLPLVSSGTCRASIMICHLTDSEFASAQC